MFLIHRSFSMLRFRRFKFNFSQESSTLHFNVLAPKAKLHYWLGQTVESRLVLAPQCKPQQGILIFSLFFFFFLNCGKNKGYNKIFLKNSQEGTNYWWNMFPLVQLFLDFHYEKSVLSINVPFYELWFETEKLSDMNNFSNYGKTLMSSYCDPLQRLQWDLCEGQLENYMWGCVIPGWMCAVCMWTYVCCKEKVPDSQTWHVGQSNPRRKCYQALILDKAK